MYIHISIFGGVKKWPHSILHAMETENIFSGVKNENILNVVQIILRIPKRIQNISEMFSNILYACVYRRLWYRADLSNHTIAFITTTLYFHIYVLQFPSSVFLYNWRTPYYNIHSSIYLYIAIYDTHFAPTWCVCIITHTTDPYRHSGIHTYRQQTDGGGIHMLSHIVLYICVGVTYPVFHADICISYYHL